MRESAFFRDELLVLLAQAGFAEVAVKGGYDEREATGEDLMVVFLAREES
jgi:hypothetical protein